MPSRKLYFSSFLLPKSDSDLDECQDAICTATGCEAHSKGECKFENLDETIRFAVADGLTTAFYSGYWAKQLVSLFHEGFLTDWEHDGPIWKQAADARWLDYLDSKHHEFGSISQNRFNQRDPAAATFCGIEISKSLQEKEVLKLRAIAVGDSCFFHLRCKQESDKRLIVEAFPCAESADFSCITSAISSYETNQLPHEFFRNTTAVLRDGDVLLIATDALCEWILKLSETKQPVWKTLSDLDASDPQVFQTIIESARREADPKRRLKDDDVALIVIKIGDMYHDSIGESDIYQPGALLPANTALPQISNFGSFLTENNQAQNKPAEIPFIQEPPPISIDGHSITRKIQEICSRIWNGITESRRSAATRRIQHDPKHQSEDTGTSELYETKTASANDHSENSSNIGNSDLNHCHKNASEEV